MRAIHWMVVATMAGMMGCAQAPPRADTPLPAVCGNSRAVGCFAREAQGRLDHCYSVMTKNIRDEKTVVDACGGFTDEDIEDLYNRARAESRWQRGVTADLQRYFEHWRETWTVLEWHYLYGGSPQGIQGDVAALRSQSLVLMQ